MEMETETAAEGRKHFVLVHGICHGGWSWYKVATLLAAAGHKVTAPDLGASGADARSLREVGTFREYTRPLTDAVGALPPGERVVIVGHSYGGLAIAAAMERFPARIAAAVFVTAFIPDTSSGLSYFLDEYVKRYPMPWMDTRTFAVHLGSEDDGSQLACFQFGRKFLSTRGYQRSPAEDITLASSLVRPASLYLPELRREPPLTENGYGSVRAFYVVCGEDLLLPKDFQLWMLRHRAGGGAVALELAGADHAPMMSTPGELSRLLQDVAGACA